MTEGDTSMNPEIERKEFERFSVEVFTHGKTLDSNEDNWVATPNLVAVIDGATAKAPFLFDGRSSGKYAGDEVKDILENIEAGVYGKQLVNKVSEKFHQSLEKLLDVDLEKTPHARPSASFVAASLLNGKVIVTQVGDVSFRVNGKDIYENSKEIDTINAKLRVEAIKKAKEETPDIPLPELMQLGRAAITESLNTQVSVYQNNPDHPLGYGVIDGRKVPEKYVRVYEFNIADINTLEIFSDGYFKIADEPTIDSWEQAFTEVEAEDPLKLDKYPSTKGSVDGKSTDDRTVMIVRFHRPANPSL
ncbi:hypothetical protein HYS91_00290 [Candidatus Daviesbacteria bacterium]|nr:hypothetical protein [Candidatus Daviesbacteria bacterium]